MWYGKICLDQSEIELNGFNDNLSAELTKLHNESTCEIFKNIAATTIMWILLENKCRNWKVCLIEEVYYITRQKC